MIFRKIFRGFRLSLIARAELILTNKRYHLFSYHRVPLWLAMLKSGTTRVNFKVQPFLLRTDLYHV